MKTPKLSFFAKFLLLPMLFIPGISLTTVTAQQTDMPVIKAQHLFDIESSFNYPSDITVGKNRQIYVVDGVNSRIKIFNAEGNHISSFGSKGPGNGQFNMPVGIDSLSDGTIYVADSGNQRIQAFDASGHFLFKFAFENIESSSPVDPTDISIDEQANRCYVIDNNNHRVLVYKKKGSGFLGEWGSRGERPGEFQYPFLCALDKQNTLYIVDVLNTRVQAMNKNGRALAYIGKWGVDRGQFYRPKGVTIDKNDHIYISDSYLGVIQVFKRFRKFIGVLSDSNSKILRFKGPAGIYIDDNMRLYIVEMLANRISVYQLNNQP
jgi:DNA-binding beta-propeller fold protein YncE